MSYTRSGIPLPMSGRPSALFAQLFRSTDDRARADYLLDSNGSVLDLAMQQTRSLQRRLSVGDNAKLDEYLTAVRSVEADLQKQRHWLQVPEAKVDYKLPEVDPMTPAAALECERIMYDIIALALQADVSRVITFSLPGGGPVFTLDGRILSAGYHGLSHHGNDPARIADYNRIGAAHVERFAALLAQLQAKTDAAGRPLLDSTVLLFGSGMGNASTHDNTNLPILVAGGTFKHGCHHVVKREGHGARLLGDLFLTILQSFGMPAERFQAADKNLNELLV